MATRGSLDVAKRELINSLNQLPPDARFGVVFYNLHATVLSDPQGYKGLMPATAVNKSRVGIAARPGRARRRHRPHDGPPRGAWRFGPR